MLDTHPTLKPEAVAAGATDTPFSPAESASDATLAVAGAGLSNDFLNHYSEVLMLIEMAACDPSIGNDLIEWQPMGYRTYFASSELRRAPAALAAYDALPEARRQAFEKLVAGMDALAMMAVFALQPPNEAQSATVVVEEAAPALRDLIAKAAAFLNSGGQDLASQSETEEAQAVIDRIIGKAGAHGES